MAVQWIGIITKNSGAHAYMCMCECVRERERRKRKMTVYMVNMPMWVHVEILGSCWLHCSLPCCLETIFLTKPEDCHFSQAVSHGVPRICPSLSPNAVVSTYHHT